MKTYINEFIGSATLVIMGAGALILSGNREDFATFALGFGLAYVLTLYLFGTVGYFNPAITLALAINGKIDKNKAPNMIVAQALGGLLGGGALVGVFALLGYSSKDLGMFGATSYGGSVTTVLAFIIESFITFIITLLILKLETKDASKLEKSILVGIAFVSAYLLAGPITGASANPIRSLSLAFFANEKAMALQHLPVYILGPIFGAILAVLFVKVQSKYIK